MATESTPFPPSRAPLPARAFAGPGRSSQCPPPAHPRPRPHLPSHTCASNPYLLPPLRATIPTTARVGRDGRWVPCLIHGCLRCAPCSTLCAASPRPLLIRPAYLMRSRRWDCRPRPHFRCVCVCARTCVQGCVSATGGQFSGSASPLASS